MAEIWALSKYNVTATLQVFYRYLICLEPHNVPVMANLLGISSNLGM
uniref:Uncharacterized protein n=1 Tax=Arundo donax TaxID=35708 RepID=A0A0A9ECS7_ARUDO